MKLLGKLLVLFIILYAVAALGLAGYAAYRIGFTEISVVPIAEDLR